MGNSDQKVIYWLLKMIKMSKITGFPSYIIPMQEHAVIHHHVSIQLPRRSEKLQNIL